MPRPWRDLLTLYCATVKICQMPDAADEYTLSDLAELADVTPRTIRYYIQGGLLRSPDVAGANTRYDEGHLWRLRLIRRLQREHLPLAEIRNRLIALDDDQVRTLVGGSAESARGSAVEYIRSVLTSRGVAAQSARPSAPCRGSHPSRPAPRPPAPVAGEAHLAAVGGASSAPPPPDRSQWERLTLSPDLELHIRRPLSRLDNRRVDRLISIARQLLEEVP